MPMQHSALNQLEIERNPTIVSLSVFQKKKEIKKNSSVKTKIRISLFYRLLSAEISLLDKGLENIAGQEKFLVHNLNSCV